jgi:hypothetical protein
MRVKADIGESGLFKAVKFEPPPPDVEGGRETTRAAR